VKRDPQKVLEAFLWDNLKTGDPILIGLADCRLLIGGLGCRIPGYVEARHAHNIRALYY